MKAPSPAFSFYPKDWLSDGLVRELTHEQKGIYVDLLSIYWLEGGLPSDLDRLAKRVNVPLKRFERLWPDISRCFAIDGNLVTQKRLEEEKAKQLAYRRSQSEKGRLGGKPKRINETEKPRLSRSLAAVKPDESLPSPSPSPSPSPTSTTTTETNNGSVRTDVRTEASGLQLTIVKANDVPASARTLNESQAAHLVFDFWRARTGQTRAQWTEDRRKRLVSRLREEPGDMAAKVRGLCLAVEGALRDPLFNGSEKGTAYLGFENLFVHKGRDRIEKLQRAALAEDGPPVGAAGAPRDELEASNKRAIEEAMRRHYEEHPDEQPVEKKALQPHVGFARVLPRNKG